MTVAQATFTQVFRPVTAALNSAFGTFSPQNLFAAGEQGVWYDPSDLTTLFQDAAGTTPVTAVEQPVGLMLDKSKGLALGSELVTNGDFSNGTTGWAAAGTASQSVVDGYLRVVAGEIFGSYQVVTTTAGKWYEVRGQIAMLSGGTNAQIRAESGTTPGSNPIASSIAVTSTIPTDVVFRFLASASSHAIYLRVQTTGSVGRFDNISVRELPGNHAYQTTSANRPTLSARYNLLTKTEQFDDAAWIKYFCTVSSNSTIAPDGTLTADRLTAAAGSNWVLYNNDHIPSLNNVTSTFSIYIKSATGVDQKVRLSINGAILSSDITITNTWQRVSFTSVGDSYQDVGLYRDSLNNGIDAFIWGADLRVANDGVGIPAYQRVNTATDYDTVGFPKYLRFNGSSSSMMTNTITPGTDKVQVFAGMRKLRDASQVMVESSTNYNSVDGAFIFLFDAVPTTYVSTHGTSGSIYATASFTDTAAPQTEILSTSIDRGLSTDEVLFIRKNGVAQTLTKVNQNPVGNFLDYPLYIGARGGTSLWFNGRIYNMIVRFGSNLTTAQITNTEKYVNSKTKAY